VALESADHAGHSDSVAAFVGERRMDILSSSVLALSLVTATVMIHYEILRGASRLIPCLSIPPRRRILAIIAGALVAHLAEIWLYAFVYFLMNAQLSLGSIAGEFGGGAFDYFYFSISSFTTLGIGDVYPQGHLRVIAGIEALNGLVLIGWSASFTYLAMEKFWEAHPR